MLESKCFWDVLIVLSSIIELWVCKKIFDYTSEKRLSDFRIHMRMYLIIVFILFLVQINVHPNIRMVVSIILTFIFYYINYNTRICSGVMITLIYWMVLLGVDALSMSTVIWVNSLDSINILLSNNLYRLQSIVLGKSALIAILYLYNIAKVEIELNKKDIIYLGIPIVANISSFFLIFKYVFQFSKYNLINESQILNISILLFLSNISIVLVIRKIRKDSKLLAEKDIMKNNIDKQYKYYMSLKENQTNVRELYHDMKNHIICMKKLYEYKYDNSIYIENIEKKLMSYDNSFDTGNILLDIILHEKKETCCSKNINFSCHINFTKCDFIEVEDVCSIFVNILDNAIEACEKINNDSKYISLEGKIIEKLFVLKVENSKSNKVNVKKNKVITDKENSFLHGLGLKSIENSVVKYKGETVIDYTEDRFIIKILIPVMLYND